MFVWLPLDLGAEGLYCVPSTHITSLVGSVSSRTAISSIFVQSGVAERMAGVRKAIVLKGKTSSSATDEDNNYAKLTEPSLELNSFWFRHGVTYRVRIITTPRAQRCRLPSWLLLRRQCVSWNFTRGRSHNLTNEEIGQQSCRGGGVIVSPLDSIDSSD